MSTDRKNNEKGRGGGGREGRRGTGGRWKGKEGGGGGGGQEGDGAKTRDKGSVRQDFITRESERERETAAKHFTRMYCKTTLNLNFKESLHVKKSWVRARLKGVSTRINHLVIALRPPRPLDKRLVGKVSRVTVASDASGGYSREERSAKHAAVHALHQRCPETEKKKKMATHVGCSCCSWWRQRGEGGSVLHFYAWP